MVSMTRASNRATVQRIAVLLMLLNLVQQAAFSSIAATNPMPERLPLTCEEDVMRPKAHGTCERPVQKNLRWGVDQQVADRICCFNRHYAEYSGYFASVSTYLKEIGAEDSEITYYDSVTGKPLFVAPRGRSMAAYKKESLAHGWPSFRDEEVVWENVRCLPNGEAVSVDGTHLGHNLPDGRGNRYCINLVSAAGNPKSEAEDL
eukprot:CAMPEP_0172724134 /NCGR_PEP_ID=MMETSP1074-20121228/85227_1 /TAXON_ID=2916 /ORGANISM="Ceratium fusus, Strain PA161109" /LENGTH=203 /DNA_ID=CAMNT_0013550509 /DNA_START=29 /DNA_END=640 /DNA_ORIENTATION=-